VVRKALVLLLMLLVVVVPAVGGCSHEAAGPAPTEPEPAEPVPTEPAGPEFPRGLFGTVFEDANTNGVRDAGEPGLQDVLVSNGVSCRPTGDDGVYNLPADNSPVFVTTPGNYASSGPWYSGPTGDNIDFGLRPAPEKDSASFTFVQMTDLHAGQAQAAALSGLAAEINALSPAFVVATGDLIVDGNDATIPTAHGWFDVYENFTSSLGMPAYQALGNHDVVSIHRADAAVADPGYGEGMFVSRFGPTYYSFDWGRYHCIVLDPNDMENGKEVYRISAAELQWLEDDLSYREEAPLLVFFHEPTVSWTNRAAVLGLLQGHSATLFCGHLHQGVTLDSGGIPEEITAAVCGEWWQGPNPDGKPAGYRLVSANADGVDSLYIGTGEQRTVDFGLAPVLSGQVDLAVKVFSRSGTGGVGSAGVSGVTCQVDDNQTLAVSVNVNDGGPWCVASASWDTASLVEGYHRLTLRASDAGGSFEEQFEFKKSLAGTVSLSDLTGHRDVFWGSYVAVEAQVGLMLTGPISLGSVSVPAGVGFMLLRDGSDVLIVFAGEVFSPSLLSVPLVLPGGAVIVKLVPLRFSMDQLVSTQEWDAYYPLLGSYLGYIPDSAREPPGAASIGDLTAVWGARWLAADDLTVKPGP
jgi:hypothetical protein